MADKAKSYDFDYALYHKDQRESVSYVVQNAVISCITISFFIVVQSQRD